MDHPEGVFSNERVLFQPEEREVSSFCSVDHCGLAPASGPGWNVRVASARLKRPSQSRSQGKCSEEVDKCKYLSFCIFTKYGFKPHFENKTLSVSNSSQDLLIERGL